VQSVMKEKKGLQWEGFVKIIGFELGVKSKRVRNNDSDEITEEANVTGVGEGESEIETLG